MRRVARLLLLATLAALVCAAPASAAFGLSEYEVGYESEGGSADSLAGSHPSAMDVKLRFNSIPSGGGGEFAAVPAKDLIASQVPGFVGNPTAVPPCPAASFLTRKSNREGLSMPDCPDASAVGYVVATLGGQKGTAPAYAAVFDLEAPSGVAAKLGFWVAGVPVPLELKVSESPPYEIVGGPTNISQAIEVLGAELFLWGVPASPVHDPMRGECLGFSGASLGECPAEVAEAPFLTMPRSCTGALRSEYAADAWEDPGARLPDGAPDLADPAWVTGFADLAPMTGCSELGFAPEVRSQPTATAGESPAGLDFDLELSDPGLTEVSGRAGSDIEKAVVTLPPGLTTNPAVANGLDACSLPQYEAERLGGAGGCPDASNLGTVEVETPLLGAARGGPLRVLHGQVYLAKQGENPFGSLLAIYLVIEEPALGIFVKLPGRVEPDGRTGQLTTVFESLPQLPFSELRLHLREGPRAPLVTPAVCATYSTAADLYPYGDPGRPLHRDATFAITNGAGGSRCATSNAGLPDQPEFDAGTVDPTAGSFSPFVLQVTRADGSQQLSRIDTTLPQGLLGRLAGIPYCSDAQIGQAASRSGEGGGAAELASPSCPRASEVGTVVVGAGAGPQPFYVTGHVYLAGPYKGGPLSLEIVTPAIAGPFDLGVVAVRAALRVDPLTAQITAESDPIPTILHGLPLDVRSVALDLSRNDFTLNPTSCEPKAITGSAISTLETAAPLAQYFQAAECGALKFAPKLSLALAGGTKRAAHPALKAVVTYPKGGAYANIARAQVSLPHSEFLDQGNLNLVCKQADLRAGTCPKKAVYGKVKAWTPLLEKPLEGNVYLGVGFGYKLPALVAELNGQIRVLLKGKVDTDKQKGIRNTFEAVPDAPVEKFVLELKGGKKYGLLQNSEDICRKRQSARAVFTAQNGRVVRLAPTISNSCKATDMGKRNGKPKKTRDK